MNVNLADVLDRRHVIPGLHVGDKGSLLRELAKRAGVALKLDEAPIAAALSAREELGSTGVGGGIAIPHARIEGLAAAFGLVARLEPALDFAAIDNRPVDLVFLLLTPAQTPGSHLALLAAISRLLRDGAVVAAVRRAGHAGEIYDALIKAP